MTQNQEITYDTIRTAFRDGSIRKKDEDTLQAYLIWLATNRIQNEQAQHCPIVMADTINQIQMARLIASLEEKNKITQRWFMILAIGSLAIGLLDLFLGR